MVGIAGQVDALHRERVGIAVNRHIEGVTVEQADPVEVLAGHIVDVGGQGMELLVVQAAVAVGLGDVLSEQSQLTHSIQRIRHLLQVTVLRLVE